MEYGNHYKRLIERARQRELDGYGEWHHIIPRCLGGTNDSDNLVFLTAREHFIAHILLVKIYPNEYKLIFAVNMMAKQFTEDRIHNRIYGWLRERLSEASSRLNIGRVGYKHTLETKRLLSELAKKRYDGKQPDHLKNRVFKKSTEDLAKIRSKSGKKAAQTRKAKGGEWCSVETAQKIREGRKLTSEYARCMASERRRGNKASDETKRKMSESRKGQVPWNKGKSWSEEEKKKRSDSVKRTRALKKREKNGKKIS